MVLRVVKVLILLVVLLVGFGIYQYHFGHIYGGKYYQRKSKNAQLKVILDKYYNEQVEYFKDHKRFRSDLHNREDYKNLGNVKIGYTNEVPEIARYCGDCTFSDSTFKVGAYSKYEDQEVVWAISSAGELLPINALKE